MVAVPGRPPYARRGVSSSAFISYRRDDSGGEAGRLADTIKDQFGDESVFFDTADIPLSDPWPTRLESALGEARVVVVVIGPGWILASDKWGRRRIDDPSDWVRREIQLGLELGKTMMPLLVRHAEALPEEAFPPELSALASIQAYPIRNNQWSSDIQYVLGSLEPFLGARAANTPAPGPEAAPDGTDYLRALAAGFVYRDPQSRIDTAKQMAAIAPEVPLDDILGLCR